MDLQELQNLRPALERFVQQLVWYQDFLASGTQRPTGPTLSFSLPP
jgi:hypothetical protein